MLLFLCTKYDKFSKEKSCANLKKWVYHSIAKMRSFNFFKIDPVGFGEFSPTRIFRICENEQKM